ncbi:MAG: phenylalanine--tRNA ligase subunit alpha [Magnetococcales bacterium]|nr:phenylalanine--tRNA ligase subunit alpha [Magnetococcales bacterium]|tara:strand:+ start:34846 stop:35904 length:1059 start_codon:yes stop_codon:yes gene_type:complete
MTSLDQLKENSLEAVNALNTIEELEKVRVTLLGKNGEITAELKKLGSLPPEERKAHGQAVNQVKVSVAQALEVKKEALEEAVLNAQLQAEKVDVTLPAQALPLGKMHPVSYVIEEVEEILSRLGFSAATGPEVETDFYNFTALNIPEDHPARQDHDTFYLKNLDADGKRRLLRTQTSNVQIHTMQKFEPPMRVMSIGRVYRNDSDLTHTPQFHQVEGLALDKNLTFGHLKGVLQTFLEEYFERKITMRLRPSYFPFTEPSAEVDIECLFCKGDGCRVCSHTGWLEVLGSGMVHRNVLKSGGVNPEEWQGFAFGAGIERLAMLKYGIHDLRLFYESGISFLSHFGKPSSTMKV